jgi:peptidoglycan hydrolase CwlO-like protein
VLGIFFFPKQADYAASFIWVEGLNSKIRNFKSWADWVSSDLLQMKNAQEQIDSAKKAVESVNTKIEETQKVVTEKIDQTNKVIDSTNKVINSTKELKNNIDNLTTISWSENSSK